MSWRFSWTGLGVLPSLLPPRGSAEVRTTAPAREAVSVGGCVADRKIGTRGVISAPLSRFSENSVALRN